MDICTLYDCFSSVSAVKSITLTPGVPQDAGRASVEHRLHELHTVLRLLPETRQKSNENWKTTMKINGNQNTITNNTYKFIYRIVFLVHLLFLRPTKATKDLKLKADEYGIPMPNTNTHERD